MSGTPELTVTVPCATCGGGGGRLPLNRSYRYAGVHCSACHGRGVTRTPVTCAGCLHHGRYGVCDKTGYPTGDDFGCTDWTAKEATGNGAEEAK